MGKTITCLQIFCLKFLPIFETTVLCLKFILIIILSTSFKKNMSGKGVAWTNHFKKIIVNSIIDSINS